MTRVGTGFFTMSSFRGARCPLSRAEKSSLVLRALKYQGTPSFPRTRWLPDEPSKAYHMRRKIFGRRKAQHYPLSKLSDILSRLGPGPIEDKTNLASAYDFTLTWNEAAGPTLFTALKEHLG